MTTRKTKAVISKVHMGWTLFLLVASALIAKSASAQTESKARGWGFFGSTGFGYESNILLNPNGDFATSVATEKSGGRFHALGTLQRTIHKNDSSQLSVTATSDMIWSFENQNLRADPTVVDLKLVRFQFGQLNKKKFHLHITPAWTSYFLDYDESGSRTRTADRAAITFDLSILQNSRWNSGYFLSVADLHSRIESTVKENLDAKSLTLKKRELFLFGPKRSQMFEANLGYTHNSAVGINAYYNMFSAIISYGAPLTLFRNTKWGLNVEVHSIDFARSENRRKDVISTFGGGLNRKLNKLWSWSMTSAYTNNSSAVDNKSYHGFKILGLIKFDWAQ